MSFVSESGIRQVCHQAQTGFVLKGFGDSERLYGRVQRTGRKDERQQCHTDLR